MPRSIWSGAISFGLVNVPVKLYSAVSRKSVRFHQLHDADHVRIQQKRVCPQDGEEVPYENIVKGYEISPDRYVVIEPEELEALDPKKTRSIEIQEFVDLDEIDPIYFDHPYYLAPGTGAQKAYRLLLSAMKETNKVAIARVVIRQKENLVAIRASGNVMTMATLVFHDEVINPETIDELPEEGEAEVSDREVDMAEQLINSLTADFEPEKYHDEYRERVLELIEAKASGEEIAIQPPEEPAKVPDLMAALEQSLAAAKGDGKGASTGRKRSASSSGNGAKKKTTSSRSRSKASSKK
ncbi:MAG TPA: Ku protein [Thermoleophilaceae bacterium]